MDESLAAPLECVATLRGHNEPCVWHVAWSPTSLTVASCAADRAIRLWAPQRGGWECVAILEDGHERTVRRVSWAPCGTLFASCSFDKTAMIWKCENGEFDCIASLEGHESEVKSVAWSPSGEYIATCGRDKSVWVWQAEEDEYEVAMVLNSHTQDVKDVVWQPNDDVLASCSYDDTIKIIKQDDDDWRCHSTLCGHTSTVWGLAFSEDGRSLASCSDDRSVVLWRDPEGCLAFRRAASIADVHDRAIYSIAWGKGRGGDKQLVTGGGDDALCLLSVSLDIGGGEQAPPAAPAVGGVQARPEDGTASLRVLGRVPSAHGGDINCVSWSTFSSDDQAGTLLASAGDDGTIRIWRAVG